MRITEISTDYNNFKMVLKDPMNNLWAIIDGGMRLNKNGKWSIEPIPSSRTRKFIDEHSFTYDEALIKLQKYEA